MPNPNIIRNLIQLTHSVDHFSDELDESAVVTKYKYLFEGICLILVGVLTVTFWGSGGETDSCGLT